QIDRVSSPRRPASFSTNQLRSSHMHLCPAAPEHASGDGVLHDTPYYFRAFSSKPLYSEKPSDYGGQRFFYNAKLVLDEIVHSKRYLDWRDVLDWASHGFNG